jgi:hypothetical protein
MNINLLWLRRVFGPKREEVAGCWRRLHNGELQSSHVSPDISRVIKSRTIKSMEHVASMEEMKNIYKILVGKAKWKETI